MSYFSFFSSFLANDAPAVRKMVEGSNSFNMPPHWRKVIIPQSSSEDQSLPSGTASSSTDIGIFKRDNNKSPPKSREPEKRNSDSERDCSSDDEEIKLAIKLSLEEDEKNKQRALEMQKLDQLERSRYENSLRGSHFEDSYIGGGSGRGRGINIQRRKSQPPPPQATRLAVSNLSTSPTKRLEFQRQFVEGIKDDSEEEHLVRHRRNNKPTCSNTQK